MASYGVSLSPISNPHLFHHHCPMYFFVVVMDEEVEDDSPWHQDARDVGIEGVGPYHPSYSCVMDQDCEAEIYIQEAAVPSASVISTIMMDDIYIYKEHMINSQAQ